MYKKNVEALKQEGCISFLDKKEELSLLNVKSEDVRKHDGKIEFYYNGTFYQLCSRFEKKEYVYYTKSIDFDKGNLIVLFGFGNLYLIRQLLKDSAGNSKLLIFEPNKKVFKYILEQEDITDIITDDRVVIFLEDELNDRCDLLIRYYSQAKWEYYAHNIQILTLSNYHMYNDFFIDVVKNITKRCLQTISILGNSLEDNFEGLRNCYHNIHKCMESNSIEEIRGKFEGYPAIIVSAGPSLDKNIHLLKEAQDKALILTCDASWRACNKNGVRPDAIASIERVLLTYQYYYENIEFPEDLVLIGPTLLHPEMVGGFKGKEILSTKIDGGLDGWWADFFENVSYVDQGMTCAGTAFSYARIAGCNPIILIGQDLAFTGDRIHSNLAHTEFEGENKKETLRTGKDILIVEDIYGNPVSTYEIYNMFRDWFEKQTELYPELKVIDATEGGAKIRGTEISTLKEVIEKYCTKELPYHMYDCLKEKKEVDKEKIVNNILKDSKDVIQLLKKTYKMADEHNHRLKRLMERNLDTMSQEKLNDVLLKISKGDKVVQYIVGESKIVQYFQAIIIDTVIYVKKIGNKCTPDNVRRNLILQKNLMEMIMNTCLLVTEEFDQLIEYVSEYGEKLQEDVEKC